MNVDWECVDCEIVYSAPEDAGTKLDIPNNAEVYAGYGTHFNGLPEFCPNCGDHGGWRKRE